MAELFDSYDKSYGAVVQSSIDFSGLPHSFFMTAKADILLDLIATRLGSRHKPAALDVGCDVGAFHPFMRGMFRRLCRGWPLGAARQSEPVHLADHRIAGNAAQLCGNLARRQAVGSQLLQRLDALVSPAHPSNSPVVVARSSAGRILRRVWATTGWPDAYPRYRFTQRLVHRTKFRIEQSNNYNMTRVGTRVRLAVRQLKDGHRL